MHIESLALGLAGSGHLVYVGVKCFEPFLKGLSHQLRQVCGPTVILTCQMRKERHQRGEVTHLPPRWDIDLEDFLEIRLVRNQSYEGLQVPSGCPI